MRLPTAPDETPTIVRNPSKEDFIYQMADDNNEVHTYTLPSRRMVTLPKYIADHLAKHLAQKIALEESPKIHYEDRIKKQLELIYIKL